jgi:hypothetical protein
MRESEGSRDGTRGSDLCFVAEKDYNQMHKSFKSGHEGKKRKPITIC